MSLRRLLPARLRWRLAQRSLQRAEGAELLYQSSEDPAMRQAFARNALEHSLRALQWWPVEFADQVPPPGTKSQSKDTGDRADSGPVPCVICGTPLPRARKGESGTGLYCSRCA